MAIDKLTITGADSGTIDLHTTEYSMQGETYQPAMAQRDTTRIGGTPLLTPIMDGFKLVIRGATKTAVKASLNDFIQAMDQADRWSNRENNVNPILLNWAADGGGVTSQSLILRVLSDRQKWLQMPISYHEDLDKFIIRPIDVRFIRSPYWLTPEESVNSSAFNNPDRMTATFTGSPSIDSPLEIRLRENNWGTTFPNWPSFTLVLARETGRLLVNNANALTATNYTTVGDTVNHSRSGTVLRFTPPDTNEHVSGGLSGLSLGSAVRRAAIFANFRSNISAVTWTIKFRPWGWDTQLPETRPLVISGADITNPKWYFCGIVGADISITGLQYVISASTTTGSPVLDMDCYCVLGLDDPTSRAVWVGPVALNRGSSGAWEYRFKHNELEEPEPSLELWQNLQYYAPSYKGDIYLYTRGTTVIAAVLGTDGSDWVIMNDAGTPAKMQFLINARRRKALLFPQ